MNKYVLTCVGLQVSIGRREVTADDDFWEVFQMWGSFTHLDNINGVVLREFHLETDKDTGDHR